MSIYIDVPKSYASEVISEAAQRYGKVWSHLWSDTSDEELHEFARQIGMRRSWFQQPQLPPNAPSYRYHAHYDLVPSRRRYAIEAGAIERTTVEVYGLLVKHKG